MNLNPAGLALFSDWARTLPPRPLPRTVTPVPGEYHLDYAARLAAANHLEPMELAEALADPAAVIFDPGRRKLHQQERLAAAAGQPPARIARLYRDDHGDYLRDRGAFRRMLRPACRRTRPSAAATGCGPVPPPAPTPASSTSARSPRSPARSAATSPSCTTTSGTKPGPRSALPPAPSARRCAPARGSRASGSACNSSPPATGSRPWPPCSAPAPGHPVVEIAIYPDVVWLAARSLRAHSTSHRASSGDASLLDEATTVQ